MLRKSSALGLDELGHASVGPATEPEKESDIGALIDMPGIATIIQSSVPKETPALANAEAERDVSSAEPANENKSRTNEQALRC
jgi:hypothetical protein